MREGCSAGFCTDGDADRIGAVAEDGSFVDAHKCFAVLLMWVLKHKKWPGAVTRAFNTTGMLDRIAKKYDRELIEHGIGFKYVCDVVLSGRKSWLAAKSPAASASRAISPSATAC